MNQSQSPKEALKALTDYEIIAIRKGLVEAYPLESWGITLALARAIEAEVLSRIDQLGVPAEGWRPIETAPEHDGHSFLVRRSVGRGMTFAMQVSRFEGQMYPDHLDFNVDYGDRITDATHWMPLPAAPKEPT